MTVESTLKDLILEDYGKKNNVNVGSLTQSEIRDIILGMEIAPPSLQRQEMAEIEQQTREQSQLTATTTKTTNTAGDEMIVTTTSAYEAQTFSSKTDWRVRAITATNLNLRTNHIYVLSEDISEDGTAYVVPKNILKRFITAGDLRAQTAGFMYGVSPEDNDQVKEVRCIVMVPQVGTHSSVRLPHQFPDHEYLRELEPLGWIHTRPKELEGITPSDVIMHARLCDKSGAAVAAAAAGEAEEGASVTAPWNPETAVVMTCSYTSGSCNLSAYRLTSAGLKWGREVGANPGPDPPGFKTTHYERVQLLLSSSFLGFFMTPLEGSWNYYFMGVRFGENMSYDLKLDNPLPFYAEEHRPSHFLNFVGMLDAPRGSAAAGSGLAEEEEALYGADDNDYEDLFG